MQGDLRFLLVRVGEGEDGRLGEGSAGYLEADGKACVGEAAGMVMVGRPKTSNGGVADAEGLDVLDFVYVFSSSFATRQWRRRERGRLQGRGVS